MKKIISLFERDYDGNRQVIDQVVPGAEWVIAGEGTPTQQLDGSCCMIRDRKLYKRYTVKNGRKAPKDFEPVTDRDPITGKQEGWVPVGDGPEDKWHRAALNEMRVSDLVDGTYELCGPKVQGNPEGLIDPVLLRHGFIKFAPGDEPPRTFDELRVWFDGLDAEGIVWHHPDGRMVKIKGKDFGIKRGVESK